MCRRRSAIGELENGLGEAESFVALQPEPYAKLTSLLSDLAATKRGRVGRRETAKRVGGYKIVES